MEIEWDESWLSKQNSEIYKYILASLRKQPFSLARARKIAQKYENKFDIFQFLMNFCNQNQKIQTRLNICRLLVEIMKFSTLNQDFDSQFVIWILKEIYQIRWEIDINIDSKLISIGIQCLNQLIILVKQLISKLEIQKNNELLLTMNLAVYQCENVRPFCSLNNVLFTLKILVLLEKGGENLYCQREKQIADFYVDKLWNFVCQTIQVQQVAISSILNCISKYQNMAQMLDNVLHKSTFYQKLVILQKCLPQEFCLQFLKLKLCSNQHQLQLITSIVSKKFDQFPQLQRQFCIFWLSNCSNICLTGGSIDLSSYIALLEPQVSSHMLYLCNNELNQSQANEINRQNLMYIWSAFLQDLKVKEHLIEQKSLFIATQLIFYRFLRQIVGQLNNTLNLAEINILLKTYRTYFPTFLQQKQCKALRTKIISYYVQYYPNYLTPYFLIKQNKFHKDYSNQITNLAIFDAQILQMLLQSVKIKKQSLIGLLSCLESEVGVALIKYIVQKDQWEYNDIFGFEQIVDYLVQNNIQIHLDKFQYELYRKISQNIQKFLKIIRKSVHKNRYQGFINSYILDLLENELLNEKGLKKLPSTFTTFIYLVQRYCDIFSIAEQKGINAQKYITALYAYANRNLFFNFPDAIFLLGLAIAQLKQNTPGAIFKVEDVFLENLSKFIKQYENHNIYHMLGFSTLILIVFGLPTQQINALTCNRFSQPISVDRLSQGLSKISNFLKSNDNVGYTIKRKEQELSQKDCAKYEKALVKILIYSILITINSLAVQNSFKQSIEVVNLKNAVGTLLELSLPKQNRQKTMEIQIQNDQVMKRLNSVYQNDQELLTLEVIQKKAHSQQQIEKQSDLEKLLNRIEGYDQFKHYRYVQCLFRNSSNLRSNNEDPNRTYSYLERVDGKVRAIFHVKK